MMKNLNKRITKTVADVHFLPFKGNSFDLNAMPNVLHYLDSPATVLTEIEGCVLKDKAFFINYFLFVIGKTRSEIFWKLWFHPPLYKR